MIIAIITSVFVILNLIIKKNKFLFILLMFWMWTIMSFTVGIADEQIYISRYTHPDLWNGSTEFVYSLIIRICNSFGLNFLQFKMLITFIQLSLIFSTVWKYSRYPNIVACLYMVYPFSLNVAQMRNALAVSVFIYSIRFLLEKDSDIILKPNFTKNDIKYIVSIFIASSIHFASILWIVLILAKKMSLRSSIIFTFLVNLFIIYVLTPNTILSLLSITGSRDRLGSYLTIEYQNSEWRHLGFSLIQVLVTAIIVISICMYIYEKNTFLERNQILLLAKMHVLILIIVGLIIRYTTEVYRLQEGLMVITIMIITNSFNPEYFIKNKVSIYYLKVFCTLVVVLFGIAYISIGLYLLPTIVCPILNNNIFINYLFY